MDDVGRATFAPVPAPWHQVASPGCRPSQSHHLTAPSGPGPCWWSKMSTKLGSGALGPSPRIPDPIPRAPSSPHPQSLVSDFPWEARLQVRDLEDQCATGVPRWYLPNTFYTDHEAHSPEPASKLATQSHWRPLWPPHSLFSSVLASAQASTFSCPVSSFLSPHKTLLAGLCLSLSHSNPPHTCGQSPPEAQLKPSLPFHKTALG